jgi:IS5 family transposase
MHVDQSVVELQGNDEKPPKAGDLMKPKKPPRETEKQIDMFKVELEDLVDTKHPLVKLAGQIPWADFDEALEPLWCPDRGRPAITTRLMVGLHYLKHTFDLSDEQVVGRWVENPYWQYFCGMKHFEYTPPIDPSSMSRWRERIGEAGAEEMLAGTIKAGLKSGVIKKRSFQRVNVDTTVQEKAISYPTDAKLYYRMREKLVRLAKENDVPLRQSYVRLGKKALANTSRYAHARQMRRARREIRRAKTYLGRVARDIERKVKGDGEREEVFAEPLAMARRLLEQRRDSKDKLYSIHAPEVECISKGKVRKRYEFGVKVGVVTTSKESFVIGMKAYHGNPYDGHTLAASTAQASRLAGKELGGDVFVDRGYRKHDYEGPAAVHIVGRLKRGIKDSLRRWMKRRAAIEPIVGHMKNDGLLDRNHLAGVEGDKINAVLCGCGQNVRKLLAEFYFLPSFTRAFRAVIALVFGPMVDFQRKTAPSPAPST